MKYRKDVVEKAKHQYWALIKTLSTMYDRELTQFFIENFLFARDTKRELEEDSQK